MQARHPWSQWVFSTQPQGLLQQSPVHLAALCRLASFQSPGVHHICPKPLMWQLKWIVHQFFCIRLFVFDRNLGRIKAGPRGFRPSPLQSSSSILLSLFASELQTFCPCTGCFLYVSLCFSAWQLVAAVQMQSKVGPIIRLWLSSFPLGRRSFSSQGLVQTTQAQGQKQKPCAS